MILLSLKKISIILILLLILFTGCKSVSNEFIALPEFKEASFSPVQTDELLSNPYIGYVTDARTKEPIVPVKLAFAKVSWVELEPTEGVFDFKGFEERNNFAYWQEKDVNLIIRFYMDKPESTKHTDIPEWLFDKINGSGVHYNKNGHFGFSPNYANEMLMAYHKKIIKALAERYDANDLVSFVELGSVGHWGEWHTTYVDEKTLAFPDKSITDVYAKDYLDNFKNKKLMMRRPFQIAKDNQFGLFNDSFGDVFQTEDYFLNWINNGYADHNTPDTHPAMPDFWKTAASGGEFANYPGNQYISDANIATTLKQLENSHTSWLGSSAPIYDSLTESEFKNLNLMLKKMGYRFSVSKNDYKNEVTVGKNLEGNLQINNSGVAPFYFNWGLSLKLFDMNNTEYQNNKIEFDLKKLLPELTTVPYSLKTNAADYAGIFKTTFSISNEKGKMLNLANKDFDKTKGVYCGNVTLKPASGFDCPNFDNPDFYNYIAFQGNTLKVKAIKKSADAQNTNEIKLFKTKNSGANWETDFALKSLDANIKTIRFMRDGKPFATITNLSDKISLNMNNEDFEYPNATLSFKFIKKGNAVTLFSSDHKKISAVGKLEKLSNTEDIGITILLDNEGLLTETEIGELEIK